MHAMQTQVRTRSSRNQANLRKSGVAAVLDAAVNKQAVLNLACALSAHEVYALQRNIDSTSCGTVEHVQS
jgi:hypothetical protein